MHKQFQQFKDSTDGQKEDGFLLLKAERILRDRGSGQNVVDACA